MNDSDCDVQIRAGRADDAEAVHALVRPYVERELLLDRSVDEINALTRHSVTAEVDGRVIGFAAVEIYSKKLAEIQCLAVAQEYHARGIGKRLVAGCVAVAAEHDVLELMAISSSEKFLQECGFDYSLSGQKRALFIHPSRIR